MNNLQRRLVYLTALPTCLPTSNGIQTEQTSKSKGLGYEKAFSYEIGMENALYETALHELAETTDLCLVMCGEQSPKETVRDNARIEGSLWTPVTRQWSGNLTVHERASFAATIAHHQHGRQIPAQQNQWCKLLIAATTRQVEIAVITSGHR